MPKYLPLFLISIFCYCNLNSQIIPNNRMYDWSSFGLKDTTTLNFNSIDLSNYGLYSSGLSPNDSLLLSIISNTSSGSAAGVILNFPAGTYLFNQTISLPGNIVLKGKGADSTILKFDLNGSGHSIEVSGSISSDTTAIIQDIYKDSSSIFVHNTSSFISGDWIRIIQNDGSLINNGWALNTVGQIVRISQVINNKLILSSKLRENYNTSSQPYIKKIILKENTGIECLKIIREDVSTNQVSNLKFSRTANCWVSGIESDKCNFAHVDVEYSSNHSISKSYFHDAHNYGSGGKAYGVMLHFTSNECLVEDNIFNHLRHSMILQAGANGNVFSYNYSLDPFWTGVFFPSNAAGEIVLHGNWPYANLFEGNDVGNIVVDNSHNANGPHNTFLRNRARGYGIFFSDTSSPGQHFIGNEITNDSLGAPFNSLNYFIQGSNHLLFGNNYLGNIDPIGTDSLPILSYAYSSIPNFIPSNQWAGIGPPNNLNSVSIPAKDRYIYNAIFSNSCGENLTDLKIINQNNFKIYPNPFSNELHILGKNIKNIKIHDSFGKLVYDQQNNFNIKNINWKNGIYLISIKSDNNSYSYKVIKN
ncbi:MAG: Uncharacterised protein [Crocinitomicaceae bacterium]|nr:MAG: Uncharacterised protein [Crocinitomicaceae bacterium]